MAKQPKAAAAPSSRHRKRISKVPASATPAAVTNRKTSSRREAGIVRSRESNAVNAQPWSPLCEKYGENDRTGISPRNASRCPS